MLKRIRIRRPSPALVVAFVALFAAGAGTAGAARLITGKQIKNGSITSSDVKDRSLLRKDFKSGQLPAGPAGPQGLPGANGRAGRDGFGTLAYKLGSLDLASGDPGVAVDSLPCDAGTYPTGGDAYSEDASGNLQTNIVIGQTFYIGADNRPQGWRALLPDPVPADTTVFVDVFCANASPPPAPVAAAKRKLVGGHDRALKVR